jgi:adenylate cyclase
MQSGLLDPWRRSCGRRTDPVPDHVPDPKHAKGKPFMKVRMRVALLTVMLILVTGTAAVLGVNFYIDARFTVEDLSNQILSQLSKRIEEEIDDLLTMSGRQGQLHRNLMKGKLAIHDARIKLVHLWIETMKVNPELTRVSLGVDATGEWYYVRRITEAKEDRLVVGELRPNSQTGELELQDWWAEDYPDKPSFFRGGKPEIDPRRRPWYQAARQAHRQVWSESYVLIGTKGMSDFPGVSCATPVFHADGSLFGVLTYTFDLNQLSRFLRDLSVGRGGFCFVIELRSDGTRQVIAHPDSSLLVHKVEKQGQPPVTELVPLDQFADPRVRTFVEHVPAGLGEADREGKHFHFDCNGVTYLGVYQKPDIADAPHWLVCVVLPRDEIMAGIYHTNRETVAIALVTLLVAVFLSMGIARLVSRPLEKLTRGAEKIAGFHIDETGPPVRSVIKEVDELGLAGEHMKSGLRSFQKYVPADLVRSILAAGKEAGIGGEARTVTIFFCDIQDFTHIAETLSPAQLVEHLGEFLEEMSQEIARTGGTVDKYIGDSIMAFWNAPQSQPDHVQAACITALRCQQRLAELRPRWQAEGKVLLHARIGIHTGEVIVGNIGSKARLNYTVIGDAVNLASRLEGLNKYYGTDLLISEVTYQAVREVIVARPIDWVSVKGKSQAVLIYQPLGLKDDAPPGSIELIELSTEALHRYRRQDWIGARQLFAQVLQLRPDDGPAREMIARCNTYEGMILGADWDGVHRLTTK